MPEQFEPGRLAALRQLNLLDTPPSEAFDRVTRMASQLFNLPISAVSLTDQDRQWFKSRVGVDHDTLPRAGAPCAQVAEANEIVVIPDLLLDAVYRDTPLARSGVRFYAGAPLTTRDGFGLGAMCVLGMQPRAITSSELASLQDLAAMVMAQVELRHAIGRIDPLSGLPNRLQFFEDLEDTAKDSLDQKYCFAVLIDLASPEQLSQASRVMGNIYVDEMINEAVRTIQAAIGPDRRAYHVAATQFAFIGKPRGDDESYILLLTQMLDAVRATANSRYVTTTVIGVTKFIPGQIAPRDVIRRIQSAAQDARSQGTRVNLYSSDHDKAHHRRFELLNDFGASLEAASHLRLLYQPRIDLRSGACVGVEALLRWEHPTLGDISPAEFIPIVEQTTMARAMTSWVLDATLSQLARWRDAGLHLRVSMNVSAVNLLEHDLVDRVMEGLAQHNLPPGCLEIEITESAVMRDAGQALAILEALHATGIHLAIDDFGTGYSSLSYLQQLPARIVKIDKSFMRHLAADTGKRSLVLAMISLLHDLNYRVVAEGIEDQSALDVVQHAGCDEAQGFLFGRAMPPEHFVEWYRNWNPDASRPSPVLLLEPSHALIEIVAG